MSLKRITTIDGEVYFEDSKTGIRVKTNQGNTKIKTQVNSPTVVRKFVLPFFVGFLGMFICHFFILLAFGGGIQFPIYAFTYPVVYPILAVSLTLKQHQLWLTNSLIVCTIPFLYWYLLLWSDGKFNISSFHFLADTGLLVIMPATVGISCLATFWFKKILDAKITVKS